ncbi:MAG: hypothetical protein J6Y22_12740 [Paludibacteraceae bacterium]|nr:hypothetical protein [Paludibacteraceae bacterium]
MTLKEKIRFKILGSKAFGKAIIKSNRDYYLSFKSMRWGGELTFGEEIEHVFGIFLTEKEMADEKLKEDMRIDMVWCYYRFGAVPREYFLMDFPHSDDKKRATYLTTRHKDNVMTEKVGRGENWDLLEDKNNFYDHFGQFFKRDVIKFNETVTREAFTEFCKKHDSFICKPIAGQCGKGVEILHLADHDNDPDKAFDYLKSKGKFIVEELIQQDESTKQFNPSSVNTVRLPAFLNKTGFHIMRPVFRTGRTGSVVDNAGNGGIFSVIDEKTGICRTKGYDEFGGIFERHPDSGAKYEGFQIPDWDKLLKFAEEVHRTIPFYPYVGWDLAYTVNKEWVLVEGNWGQIVCEYAEREGVKKMFDDFFDD